MKKKRGLFITFEGGEGAGKTTLITKLARTLKAQKLSVLHTRAPGGTSMGQKIRTLLLHDKEVALDKRAELFLFLADRAQHVCELLLPALEQGTLVLCDRFNDSTRAYQAGARGFPDPFVRQLCDFACQGLQPDLTFYLDLDPKIGFARGKNSDKIESESLAFHRRIRTHFRNIAKQEPKRCILLDASLSAQEVYTRAQEKLDALIHPHRK